MIGLLEYSFTERAGRKRGVAVRLNMSLRMVQVPLDDLAVPELEVLAAVCGVRLTGRPTELGVLPPPVGMELADDLRADLIALDWSAFTAHAQIVGLDTSTIALFGDEEDS